MKRSPCSLNPSWQLCPDIPDDQTVSESIHLPVRLRCPFLWKTKRQKHNRLPSALAPADGRVQAAQRQNRPFVRSAVLPAGARTIVSPLTPAYPRVKGGFVMFIPLNVFVPVSRRGNLQGFKALISVRVSDRQERAVLFFRIQNGRRLKLCPAQALQPLQNCNEKCTKEIECYIQNDQKPAFYIKIVTLK